MATDIRLKESLPDITEALVATYTECSRINHLGHKPLPSREAMRDILADLHDILYPGYGRRQNLHIGNVEYYVGELIDGLHDKLTQQIARALRHEADCGTAVGWVEGAEGDRRPTDDAERWASPLRGSTHPTDFEA